MNYGINIESSRYTHFSFRWFVWEIDDLRVVLKFPILHVAFVKQRSLNALFRHLNIVRSETAHINHKSSVRVSDSHMLEESKVSFELSCDLLADTGLCLFDSFYWDTVCAERIRCAAWNVHCVPQ